MNTNTTLASAIAEATLKLEELEDKMDSVVYARRCADVEAWRLEMMEPSWTYEESMRYAELCEHSDKLSDKLEALKCKQKHLRKLLKSFTEATKELRWLEEVEG